MASESDGDDTGGGRGTSEAKKRKMRDSTFTDDEGKYHPFTKTGYKRTYPDNFISDEYPVYVESQKKEERLGNRNPLQISKLFKNVKGIHERRRVNSSKITLIFKQAAAANDFLSHECLKEHNMRAYIPAASVERVGVVRYIPKEASNEELYAKLTADQEIIAVRRFLKKESGKLVPLTTISVTFVGTNLPQFIYLDNWRYRVYEYIPPVMQCYRCMKFNHSAKVCRNNQVCSKCSEGHSYKDCNSTELKCSNCGGDHLAISKACPIKLAKTEQNKKSFANIVKNSTKSNSFPPLPAITKLQKNNIIETKPKTLKIDEIVKNEKLINCLIKTLVSLGNSNSIKTTTHIRETLIKNLGTLNG